MGTLMEGQSLFTIRACPFCGGSEGDLLFDLSPAEFCSVNWTYRSDYAEVLTLPEDARFPIDRCRACGFVYARLLPAQEFLSMVYDAVVARGPCGEGSENKESYARRMQYLATLLRLAPSRSPLRVLDFGCGLGVTLRFLEAAGVDAVGYEPSPPRAELSRSAGHRVAQELRELAGPFDLIICDNVLEHVPDPIGTLRLFASLSTPGTTLFVSVPNYERDFVERQYTAWRNSRPIDMTLNPWEHLNYFDLEHLDRMLSRCGFQPVVPPELPGHVDVDLRPERTPTRRVANAIASTFRLALYLCSGEAHRTVNHVFYRYTGS